MGLHQPLCPWNRDVGGRCWGIDSASDWGVCWTGGVGLTGVRGLARACPAAPVSGSFPAPVAEGTHSQTRRCLALVLVELVARDKEGSAYVQMWESQDAASCPASTPSSRRRTNEPRVFW